MKTNLLIAGACKCGTSFLHDFLGSQTDICASSPKEPYFFELPKEKRNEGEYFSTYFKSYSSEKYLLDSRYRNMFFSEVPKLIYDYNSDAKIIFLLRDPIERAYSHWWMWYSRKIIKNSFYTSIRKEINRINKGGGMMDFKPEEYIKYVQNRVPGGRMAYADAYTIVESGMYYQQIECFKRYFMDKNILIIDYKEISDLDNLSKKIEQFLNINISPKKQEEQIVNKAPKYLKKKSGLAKFLPKKIKKLIKDTFYKKPKMKTKSYQLLQSFFLEENKKLIENYNLDFVKKWGNKS